MKFIAFDYFRLFIVATGCPSERQPSRRRLVVTGGQGKDTGQNYWELRLVL